ncbi:hypothetical protein [Subtercola sp. RTI3]|uniref:hypothetical protein n=1 Tax=Subtercola sp. RTI3 TaxID=3048639 RepID=UPI002B238C2C|nr:hypothetical protein [Subtercola sp. RTI3]MEA9983652.1 hypothetical protein [Subtercola sp. RTI3]
MQAFATYTDLGTMLNRTFNTDEQAWITSLLEAASAYLREDVIGQNVFPQSQVTYEAQPDGGTVEIPAKPLISVDSVRRAGIDVPYTRRDMVLSIDPYNRFYSTNTDDFSAETFVSQGYRLTHDDPVTVTFTYGYALAPEGLKRWACVLVSQTLIPLELKLGLTAGGLSSVAIDDFKAAWADAGDMSGMALSDRNILSLQNQYGASGVYSQMTR